MAVLLRKGIVLVVTTCIAVLTFAPLTAPPAGADPAPPSLTVSWNSLLHVAVVSWSTGSYASAFITDTTGGGSQALPGALNWLGGENGNGTAFEPVTTAGTRTYLMQTGTYGPGFVWQAGPSITAQVSISFVASQSGQNINVSWNFGSGLAAFITDTTGGGYQTLPGALNEWGGEPGSGSAVETNQSYGLHSYVAQVGSYGPGLVWQPNSTVTYDMLVQPPSGDTSATWSFEPYNSTDPSAHFTAAASQMAANSGPNDVVFDNAGDGWVSSEFTDGVVEVTPTGTVQNLTVPQVPSEPAPFFQNAYGIGQSNHTTLAEQIIRGPNSTIWFSQGGQDLPAPAGSYTNQARLIGYDPAASQFCIYDTPTASGASPTDVVNGLAWDSVNHRIWFTDWTNSTVNWFTAPTSSCGPQSGPSGSTNGTLTKLVACSGNNPPANCVHSIPTAFTGSLAGNMVFDPVTSTSYPQGSVWYVNVFGSSVERVNIATSAVTVYALPTARTVTSAPYYLATDSGGYVYVAEYLDGAVARINKTTGAVNEVLVPSFASGTSGCKSGVALDGTTGLPQVHSLSLGTNGRLYFSTTYCDSNGAADSAVGYLNVNAWGSAMTGYILTTLPATSCTSGPCSVGLGFEGVAVDNTNSQVMVTDIGDSRVIDLHGSS